MSYIVVEMRHFNADAHLTWRQNESSITLTAMPVVAMDPEWPPPKNSCVLDISSQLSFVIALR